MYRLVQIVLVEFLLALNDCVWPPKCSLSSVPASSGLFCDTTSAWLNRVVLFSSLSRETDETVDRLLR